MMKMNNTPAFVGVQISNTVFYNVVESDGEFEYTGLSILHYLKQNKNDFVAKIFESQNYDTIQSIHCDEFNFGPTINHREFNNTKTIDTGRLLELMGTLSEEHFYVFDYITDSLIIKIPEMTEPLAISYSSNYDVRRFINKILYD